MVSTCVWRGCSRGVAIGMQDNVLDFRVCIAGYGCWDTRFLDSAAVEHPYIELLELCASAVLGTTTVTHPSRLKLGRKRRKPV